MHEDRGPIFIPTTDGDPPGIGLSIASRRSLRRTGDTVCMATVTW